MEAIQVQNYLSYRVYIEGKLSHKPFGRGAKALLAKHLGCQPSFISQILKERAVLSLEQANDINSFFEHSPLEKDFFMTLVEYNNSGTAGLKSYFETKLEKLKKEIQLTVNRVSDDELSENEILTYYNNKIHILIHHLANIPKYQTRNALKEKLELSENEINESIVFLTRSKMLHEDESGKILVKRTMVHVKKNSPLSDYANINLRLDNIKNSKQSEPSSMNYAAYFTCSKLLYEKFKRKLEESVQELYKEIPADPSEQVNSIIIDLRKES